MPSAAWGLGDGHGCIMEDLVSCRRCFANPDMRQGIAERQLTWWICRRPANSRGATSGLLAHDRAAAAARGHADRLRHTDPAERPGSTDTTRRRGVKVRPLAMAHIGADGRMLVRFAKSSATNDVPVRRRRRERMTRLPDEPVATRVVKPGSAAQPNSRRNAVAWTSLILGGLALCLAASTLLLIRARMFRGANSSTIAVSDALVLATVALMLAALVCGVVGLVRAGRRKSGAAAAVAGIGIAAVALVVMVLAVVLTPIPHCSVEPQTHRVC